MVYPYLFWLPWDSFAWTVSPNSIPHNFLVPSIMKCPVLWLKRAKRGSAQGTTFWGCKSSVKAEVIPEGKWDLLLGAGTAAEVALSDTTLMYPGSVSHPLIAASGSEGSTGSSAKLVWVRCWVLLPSASDTNIWHLSSRPQTLPGVCALSGLIPKVLSPWQHTRPHDPCGALNVGCLSRKWQLSKTEEAAQMRNAGFSDQHGWDRKCFQFQLENQSL